MLPRSALEHERRQDALHDFADKAVRRAWRAMSSSTTWQAAWTGGVAAKVTDVLDVAQQASVASSQTYMAAVLAELDLASLGTLVPDLVPESLHGVTGDGRPVESGAYGAVIHTVEQFYAPSAPADEADNAAQALASGEDWLAEFAASLIADADRAAQAVLSAVEPKVAGYVRMVEPGACSRCIILAGRFYRYNEGFLRHPSCRCRHIPADENVAGDFRTNASDYFDQLTSRQQDETFTKAGAEAIRLGADPAQVVNARRGMQVAQVHGRDALVTTAGRTKRTSVRLMPETILAEAKDREDAIRLLRVHGYIT